MRILMVTDALKPPVNGVVRTLEPLEETLAEQGVQTEFLTPRTFKKTRALPTYPESAWR